MSISTAKGLTVEKNTRNVCGVYFTTHHRKFFVRQKTVNPEDLTAVPLTIQVFWDVILCR